MSKPLVWNLLGPELHGKGVAPSLPEVVETELGPVQFQWTTLTNGRSQGVQQLSIDTGRLTICLLPTRGMSIWKCWVDGNEFGWQSPVQGPVHPMWVPITDPNGLGWLEGFDELFVRCGLDSFGAPVFDEQGLKHPLHGRIGNLPTHQLQVGVDPLSGVVDVHAWITESRFLVRALSLHAHFQFRAGQAGITINDTVTNLSSRPGSMQLLYHINVGQPLLESGASVHVPLKSLCPRNAHSAKSLDRWNTYQGPTAGFNEEVYFAEALADRHGWCQALLTDQRREHALGVRFETRTLPYFNLWKNTAAVEDGYVTGLEPATGFPNQRPFEESQGRVLPLAGGESKSFRLQLEPMVHSSRIDEVLETIAKQQNQPIQISLQPDPRWCQA